MSSARRLNSARAWWLASARSPAASTTIWASPGRLQGGVADAALARAGVGDVPLARVGELHQLLPQRGALRLTEHAPLEVHRGEQLGVGQQHLGLAEEQVAVV